MNQALLQTANKIASDTKDSKLKAKIQELHNLT